MLHIQLLGTLQLDIGSFLSTCRQALGYNLSAALDSRSADVTTQPSWLTLLAGLKNKNAKPEAVLENPGHTARHSFYCFLVVAPPSAFTALLEHSPLRITRTPTLNHELHLGVASGTVEEIRNAIVNGCSEAAEAQYRTFASKLMQIMELQGFSRLWSNYRKNSLPDGTIKLIERKS